MPGQEDDRQRLSGPCQMTLQRFSDLVYGKIGDYRPFNSACVRGQQVCPKPRS